MERRSNCQKMIGGREEYKIVITEGNFGGDGTTVYLDCGSGYIIYVCVTILRTA